MAAQVPLFPAPSLPLRQQDFVLAVCLCCLLISTISLTKWPPLLLALFCSISGVFPFCNHKKYFFSFLLICSEHSKFFSPVVFKRPTPHEKENLPINFASTAKLSCIFHVTTSEAALRKSHHPFSKNLSTKSRGAWRKCQKQGWIKQKETTSTEASLNYSNLTLLPFDLVY